MVLISLRLPIPHLWEETNVYLIGYIVRHCGHEMLCMQCNTAARN
jgi:hypothetical protein